MNNVKVESLCVFGSSARGTEDNLSDRDILVVAEDSIRRTEIAKQWTGIGWSVAAYSPSRFLKLVETGSLFIQHLKFEGQILRDNGGWLETVLQFARPNTSYAKDKSDSVFLVKPIERLSTNSRIGTQLLAADLSYVAVRNFGICHLADKGLFTFDFDQIVSQISVEFELSSDEENVLKSLRQGKAAYRKGIKQLHLEGTVGELRELLSKLFMDNQLGRIDREHPIRKLSGGYTMLRDFEASVVAQLGRAPNSSEAASLGLGKIWKWVMNPRHYSWIVRQASQRDYMFPSRNPSKRRSEPRRVWRRPFCLSHAAMSDCSSMA